LWTGPRLNYPSIAVALQKQGLPGELAMHRFRFCQGSWSMHRFRGVGSHMLDPLGLPCQ
jgi:hypothetical protein